MTDVRSSDLVQIRNELRNIKTTSLRGDINQAITDIAALDTRLDTAETDITALETFDSNHVAASDPHTGYQLESGNLGGYFGTGFTNEDVSGFTNTSYADLDALTTVAFASPVIVTLTTGTLVLVIISAARMRQNTGGTQFLSYKVTGASSIIADDDFACRTASGEGIRTTTVVHPRTVTAGSNTFELQARVVSNNGDLSNPSLTVVRL